MRKRFLPPAILVLAVLAVALVRIWTGGQQYHSDSVLLMDTLVEVSVWGKGRVSAAAAADSAIAAIAGIDSLLGDAVFDAGCETALLGCPPVRSILDVCARANRLTGGLFDPTVGSVSRLWDFAEGGVVPDPDSLTVALSHIGLGRLLALEGPPAAGQFVLDLGGVAKGHAVDLASAAVRRLGFRSAIINAGGDMRLVGRRPDGKPWRIAVRHPRRPDQFIGYLELEDCAVATSGDYERCFFADGRRYHHILDPRTGMPGERSVSVTVVGPEAAWCDALATGLFLLGPREGARALEALPGIGAVFVYADGESLAVSDGLAGRFERCLQ